MEFGNILLHHVGSKSGSSIFSTDATRDPIPTVYLTRTQEASRHKGRGQKIIRNYSAFLTIHIILFKSLPLMSLRRLTEVRVIWDLPFFELAFTSELPWISTHDQTAFHTASTILIQTKRFFPLQAIYICTVK